ncbi:YphA family membrane protein [Guptibacillus algicola]|uniref:YphA family membrane protein n=1 Tax=Guptibacillus algicola TaxID=225844 RepID=UPI001CD4B581|nr:hypothetical protein [Alkalihalobacillus algicola]MCA0985802.1 hypothetical protein [Alkalihalobacillus algicola]
MDGALFVWFSWIGIVVIGFFIKPTQNTKKILILCLLILCVANVEISVALYSVNGALILCWVLGYFLLMRTLHMNKVYAALIVLMLTAAYASIELFSIYDPVFSYLYTPWAIGLALFTIVHLSVQGAGQRCALLMLSIVQGEIILSVIYQQMGIHSVIGRFVSLDIMAISVMGTFMWDGFVQLTSHLENVLKKHQERRGYS